MWCCCGVDVKPLLATRHSHDATDARTENGGPWAHSGFLSLPFFPCWGVARHRLKAGQLPGFQKAPGSRPNEQMQSKAVQRAVRDP